VCVRARAHACRIWCYSDIIVSKYTAVHCKAILMSYILVICTFILTFVFYGFVNVITVCICLIKYNHI
jgi:hypothetical protein